MVKYKLSSSPHFPPKALETLKCFSQHENEWENISFNLHTTTKLKAELTNTFKQKHTDTLKLSENFLFLRTFLSLSLSRATKRKINKTRGKIFLGIDDAAYVVVDVCWASTQQDFRVKINISTDFPRFFSSCSTFNFPSFFHFFCSAFSLRVLTCWWWGMMNTHHDTHKCQFKIWTLKSSSFCLMERRKKTCNNI